MEAYKRFIRLNKDFVHSLESMANGLTWFLPERFSNSEIGPEAVYAFLGIMTSVNQYIIDTTPNRFAPQTSTSSPFPWSLCVSALKDLEAVVEVAAEHFYGDKGKWNFIIIMETAKAVVRLALLRDSGYKMLLQGGELTNEDKSPESHEVQDGHGMPNGSHGPQNSQGYYRLQGYDPRNMEGRALFALRSFGENAKLVAEPSWINRPQPFPEIPATPVMKTSLLDFLSKNGINGGLFLMEEMLFILRPLIYVIFIKRFGVSSWKPWLLSLAVDFTGTSILNHVRDDNKKAAIQLSSSEKDEVRRRKLLWALYLMRDPFFSRYTRPRLKTTEKYLNHVPLLGFLSEKLVELLIGAQTRYTYTSGS